MAKHLDLEIDLSELQRYVTDFLDHSLRHTVFKPNELLLDGACPPLAREVYTAFLDVASDKASFDDLESDVVRWLGEFERLKSPLLLLDKFCAQIAERDGQLAERDGQLAERDGQLAERDGQLAERDGQLAERDGQLAERDGQLAERDGQLAERDGQLAGRDGQLAERDGQLAERDGQLAERDGQLAERDGQLAERDGQIASLNQALTKLDGVISQILASNSWRVTYPLRAIKSYFFTQRNLMKSQKSISNNFDSVWYLKQYRDVAVSGMDPYEHFLSFGKGEGRLPMSDAFNSKRAKLLDKCIAMYVSVKRVGSIRRAISKAWAVYKREGWNGVKRSVILLHSVALDRNEYAEWIRRYDTLTDETRAVIRARIAAFSLKPTISVVMPTYNPKAQWLTEAIESVRNQIYPHWELCIADDASCDKTVRDLLEWYTKEDARIKVVFREKNGHISAASNSALTLASGQWAALLDHDDLLTEHALFWVADAINHNPEVGLIYSDEDKIDVMGKRYDPYFKCELNSELLLAQNMVSHLGVYKLDLLKSLGGFRTGFEGAQDYDLALRAIEQLSPEKIIHIPRVLYHWRAVPGSTALATDEKNYAADAGRLAVAEHLKRRGIAANVTAAPEAQALNRVRFTLPNPLPLVSVIIPTRDHVDLLSTCVHSILKLTTYPVFEIIIIDNGSVETATADFFASLPADRVKVIRDDSPFNFSALNNHGAQTAHGELLCLMNNDIEILTPDWLDEMVSFAMQPEVGCVGARLWYPDGRLQHGGVVVGVGGVAGHSHKYASRGFPGYFARAVLHQSFSAVTAACLVVRRTVFDAVNGLDEALAIAFNDVDFCLRIQAAGYRNVWTPYAEMIHHESVSRGHEDTPEKQARFANEVHKMQARWGEKLMLDPAYSPNLSLDSEDFSFAWPPRVEHLTDNKTSDYQGNN